MCTLLLKGTGLHIQHIDRTDGNIQYRKRSPEPKGVKKEKDARWSKVDEVGF